MNEKRRRTKSGIMNLSKSITNELQNVSIQFSGTLHGLLLRYKKKKWFKRNRNLSKGKDG